MYGAKFRRRSLPPRPRFKQLAADGKGWVFQHRCDEAAPSSCRDPNFMAPQPDFRRAAPKTKTSAGGAEPMELDAPAAGGAGRPRGKRGRGEDYAPSVEPARKRGRPATDDDDNDSMMIV